MLYREAVTEDIAEIIGLRLSVKENRLADPSRVTHAMCAEYLTTAGKGWVCVSEGQIVGFSIAASADASIWALFVRPGFEGRGIGQALLDLAVKWLFENGASEVSLSTDPGTRADRFYQANGWVRGEIISNGEVKFRLPKST